MAVELPSDIVADVMRNADPVRRSAATGRLQAVSGADQAEFSRLVDNLPVRLSNTSDGDVRVQACDRGCDEQRVYKDFERMFLRSLFETLLPREESGTFGSGPSAGVWRSLASDQLAGVYAENGGVGIAGMMAPSSSDSSMRSETQWPYFSLGSIANFRG